ncbi:hypothetical protein Prudu_009462, partial [Prunus dulcis]
NFRIVKRTLWFPWARLTRIGKFDRSVDRVSPDAIPLSELGSWTYSDHANAAGGTLSGSSSMGLLVEFWEMFNLQGRLCQNFR